MEEKVHALLEKHSLLHVKKDVLDNLHPCLTLTLEQADKLPVGISKMGGLPDLPKGTSIPSYNDRPLTFIAQYNLTEMNDIPFETGLPQTGMLYFFYDAEEQEVWGEAEQQDGWRILYYDGDMSAVEPAPLPVDNYFLLSQCQIHFTVTKTLDVESLEGSIEIADEWEDQYYEFLDDLHESTPFHQAFGYPFAVQNDVFEECAWYSKQEGKEWALLLQVDSDEDNLNIMWGDVGMIYFCIPKDALEQRKFDETWMIYQCH